MPRRFRLPEGIRRRLILSLGILLPFVLYGAFRAFPATRDVLLRAEARVVRVTTRMREAARYVFLEQEWEENALIACTNERERLLQELGVLRYTNVGPVRTLPIQVVARAYAADDHDVLVWKKEEGELFVLGEGVGVGTVLLGRVIEAENDLAVVRTLTHPESAIPAMIAGKEHIGGIAVGTGGAWLELRYVPKGSAVEIGDTLVTSGLGGGMMRGLTLGTVREIIDADPSPFYRMKVEPIMQSASWWEAEVFHLPVL